MEKDCPNCEGGLIYIGDDEAGEAIYEPCGVCLGTGKQRRRCVAGDRVIHSTWGKGTVAESVAEEDILIEFDEETQYGKIIKVSTCYIEKVDKLWR